MGLGEGVASADSVGVADSVGSAGSVVDGEARPAEAEGEPGPGVDAEGDGEGAGGGVALDVPSLDGGGELTGVTVHPASTPAHTRALRAIVERLTTSG